MLTFLTIAIGILAGIGIFWPMLTHGRNVRRYGISLVVALPIVTLMLYQQVGTPLGIGVSGTPDPQATPAGNPPESMDELIARLEVRMQENPADVQGWVLLGRSYKTLQRYAEAETALTRAFQIAPDDPLVLAELAEARLFASGDPEFTPEITGMLEQALRLDPEQQKSLWLLGIAARQQGDAATAVQYWQKLLGLLDPASPVAQSVQAQLDQAGIIPAPDIAGTTEGPAGWDIVVALDGDQAALPNDAVLFVIARDPEAPSPPLGAKRVTSPEFPVRVSLSDADSMMSARPISGASRVQFLARLSMSGSPVAGDNDLESPPVTVPENPTGPIELRIRPAGN